MKTLTKKNRREIEGYILLGFKPVEVMRLMKDFRKVSIAEQRIGQIRKQMQEVKA